MVKIVHEKGGENRINALGGKRLHFVFLAGGG